MYSTQKTTVIAALIAVLVLFSYAHAKPPPADLGYEPPDGWEFVMKLDSLSGSFLHCHNDTCYFTAAFSGSREIPFFHRLSTDGGETWEDIKEIYPLNFKMNSNTLHRMTFDMGESQYYYELSYDFYKTSERYKAINLSLGEKDLLESPIDTNTLNLFMRASKTPIRRKFILCRHKYLETQAGTGNCLNCFDIPMDLLHINSILIGQKKGIGSTNRVTAIMIWITKGSPTDISRLSTTVKLSERLSLTRQTKFQDTHIQPNILVLMA
jgi:hypothetical protein